MPTQIEAEHFDEMIEVSNPSEVSAMHSAYIQDENALPRTYKLRSLDTISNWARVEPVLRQIVFNHASMKQHEVSMTAQEVDHAISKDTNRIISVTAVRNGSTKEENHDKQYSLIETIKSTALHRIEIDRSSSETNHIAKELLKVLLPPLERLKRVQTERKDNEDDLELEIAHQMKFASDRDAKFVGRSELLELITWQIKSDEGRNIFLFSGRSGSGKSSLLAKLAVTLCAKFKYVPLIRFCGTTKMTSQKDHLLKSFVRQLEAIFKMTLLNKDQLTTVEQFDMAISLASEQTATKLIFVIDSIDQMDANSCANINWLPKTMPANTFLLLSTVSDESTTFQQLDSSIRHYYNDRIIVTEIQPLNHNELDQMTESYLRRFNRTLQPEQRATLTALLFDESKEKPTVFRSQLILSLAKNLTSYQRFPTVEPTVNGTLTVIYQNLCANHGTMLTNNVLGLISIPRHGFTEPAILDILSGHEALLDDVFQYHKPRVRRLPELILKRLLHEIEESICRPTINGHRVIRYFHRQFHKFFKQFRTEEQYRLATKYFNGSLAKLHPEREIHKNEGLDALAVSELPFLLLKTSIYDQNYLEELKSKLMDISHIQHRIRYGQLQEYLDDCEATLKLRPTIKRISLITGLDRLQLVVEFLQKKKNLLEVSCVCMNNCRQTACKINILRVMKIKIKL